MSRRKFMSKLERVRKTVCWVEVSELQIGFELQNMFFKVKG